MKKLLTLTAIILLAFASCEEPADENVVKLPKLTIRNESSFVLTDVKFSGISFSSEGSNELPKSTKVVKTLTENDLNKAGYITFVRKDIGIALRTEAIAISDKDFTFTFLDTTSVEEQGNSSNRRDLAHISFLSKVTVEKGGLPVAKNETINLGDSVVNHTLQTEFTIKNTGDGKLLFGVNEPVKISGEGSSVFSIIQPSGSEVASNSSISFRINFTPVQQNQNYNAVVTISSNDQNGDFIFNIRASGVPPKPIAKVFFSDTEISQNGTINVGEIYLTQSKDISIVIKNSGTEVLTIDTANILITGAQASAFTRTTYPGSSISIGGETTFLINCEPVRIGENNATLTIPTNDNLRNPIIILLRMSAVSGSAVMELTQNGKTIQNSIITPLDFGQIEVGLSSMLTFKIKNNGNIALNLTGTPSLASSNPVFSISTLPTSVSINPGEETNFILRFLPTSEEEVTGNITILNNSSDSVFTFSVKGKGHIKKPQITLRQGVSVIQPHGEYDFGIIAVNKHSDLNFTIGNSGDANLTFETVEGNRINLADNTASLFSVIQQPSSSTVVTPGNTTTFTVRFHPAAVGSNFSATVRIISNSRDNNEFSFTVKGGARAANSEARLNALQFSTGTLNPVFNANIYSYNLRIQAGPTIINVRPTSMDANTTTIKVNGISQQSGVLSQDIILAYDNIVTIDVIAENGTTNLTYTINIIIVKTWERLHGQSGRRYGILRAISNGEGGIYAGGYTNNSTAALFNIDQSGTIQNTFTYSSIDGTVGPARIGFAYNDYYSVYQDSNYKDYYITKAVSPSTAPTRVRASLSLNGKDLYMYPRGIERNNTGYYFVAGNAHYYATATTTLETYGIFINRHLTNGNWEKGTALALTVTGTKAQTHEVSGMTILLNGDILLYGIAESTNGKEIAFAAAVNVSNDNTGSWAVRWSNTYDSSTDVTGFNNHFWDSSSNLILLGWAGSNGLVAKFSGNATTAATAKPTGWRTVITGNGQFLSGLATSDGYVLVGQGSGTGSNGEVDIWVVKTNNSVVKAWEKYFGGTGMDYADSIVEMSDAFIIAGATQSPSIAGQSRTGIEDIYLIKMNKDGTMD